MPDPATTLLAVKALLVALPDGPPVLRSLEEALQKAKELGPPTKPAAAKAGETRESFDASRKKLRELHEKNTKLEGKETQLAQKITQCQAALSEAERAKAA